MPLDMIWMIILCNSYDVFVYTDYNLNDGVGNIPGLELGSYTVKTDAKDAPSAIIQNLEAGTESITMDIKGIQPFDLLVIWAIIN